MKLCIIIVLLFLFIPLLSIIDSENKDIAKSISCKTIINKRRELLNEDRPGTDKFLLMMLRCFIMIKDDQIKEIISKIDQGLNPNITIQEMNELAINTNLDLYNEEEIKYFSNKMEKSFGKYVKMQNEKKDKIHFMDLLKDENTNIKKTTKIINNSKLKNNRIIVIFSIGLIILLLVVILYWRKKLKIFITDLNFKERLIGKIHHKEVKNVKNKVKNN